MLSEMVIYQDTFAEAWLLFSPLPSCHLLSWFIISRGNQAWAEAGWL